MAAAVWVTDVASVTALGRDLEALWHKLLKGHSAIAPVERFPVKGYRSRFAACIGDLGFTGNPSAIHDLLNRLMDQMGPVPMDVRLYTATAKAGIDNLERLRRGQPADTSNVLVWTVAEQLRRRLALTDAGDQHFRRLRLFRHRLGQRGRPDCRRNGGMRTGLLFGPGHGICFFPGFSALGALSPRPVYALRPGIETGLTLGEGAACLLLMNAHRARKEGRPHLGTVLGWGVASDAFHVTAPDPKGSGLVAAVRLALKRARLDPQAISAVCAHGTGTVYNDLTWN